MTEIFRKISAGAPASIISNVDAAKSRKWFGDKAKTMAGVSGNQLMSGGGNNYRNNLGAVNIGSMVMFFYNPTTKEKLPYYDRFPVIFPIEMNKKGANGEAGFLGINMHYLSPTNRAKLMNALYNISKAPNPTPEDFRMKISYKILKGAASTKLFKPCIKHYLYRGLASRFFLVDVKEWDFIVSLPIERFESGGAKGGKVGAPISKQRIWAKSMEQI